MSACLTDFDLNRLHSGDMAPDEAARAREHLATCAVCAKRDAALVAEHEDLLRHVRDLQGAVDLAAAFAKPAADVAVDTVVQSSNLGVQVGIAGDRVGPYRLREVLGEGGFGVVYLADQVEPIQRRVALKVLKPGMDTKRVIARFEAERQALAMMDHPNVARVLDAGATEQGRPYFVMEYVPGVPITDYCDRHTLSTQARLDLFIQVCDAVQHAHQKGIIHRDIKPSNVLVAVQDDQAIPKVIDFGVAKAVSRQLTEQTIYTEQGQLIGTPEYMSPEQAEMSGLNIDTRTDIYSLGVLLYELLAGALPFDPTTLRQAGYAEIQRIIREQEPPKPSTRLSGLGGQSITVAHQRRTDLVSLAGQLRGDLDWITMKAMDKDRTRRYSSASELAADIRRHLNNEVVAASPPSTAYRVRKFVRRHRLGVLAGAAVAVALILGIIGTTTMAAVASRQREAALAARNEAEQARGETERQAGVTKAINVFLQDMLSAPDPFTKASGASVARSASVVDLLNLASQNVEAGFKDQPEVEAGVRATLGRTYLSLSLISEAEPHLRRALEIRRRLLGEEHPDTLKSKSDWANYLASRDRFSEAIQLLREVLEARRRLLGSEDPDTLKSLNELAQLHFARAELPEAVKLLREAWQTGRRVLGEEHRDTLWSLNNLATALRFKGDLEEAESSLRAAVEAARRTLGEKNLLTLTALNNLALVTYDKKDYEKAEQFLRLILKRFREVLSEEHAFTLMTMNNLGQLLQERGKLPEAEQLLRRALEVQRRVLGDQHSDTLTTLHNLAGLLEAQGKPAEAEPLYSQVLEGLARVLPADHPDLLRVRFSLANNLRLQSKFAEAERGLRQVLEAETARLGEADRSPQTTMYWLARTLVDQEKRVEAEAMWRKLLDLQSRHRGETDADARNTLGWLAQVVAEQGRQEEAERLYVRQVELCRKAVGDDHVDTATALIRLARVVRDRGRLDEAEALYREVAEVRRKALGAEHADTLDVLERLASVIWDQDRLTDAEAVLREVFAARDKTLGAENRDTLRAMGDLALLLKKKGDIREAERLYRECLEIDRRLFGVEDRYTLTALNGLANVLRDDGRPEEAETLYAELLDAAPKVYTPEQSQFASFQANYGKCLLKLRRFQEAESLLLAAYTTQSKTLGEQHRHTRESLAALIELYESWGRPEQAREFQKKEEDLATDGPASRPA